MRAVLFASLLVLACAPKRVDEDRGADDPTPEPSGKAVSGSQTSAQSMAAQMAKQQAMMREAQDRCAEAARQELSEVAQRELGNARAVRFIEAHGPLIADAEPAVTKELARIGQRLARGTQRPQLPWTFGVVDSPAVLTFSGAGGYVLVTTGLVKQCRNEAALAGALANAIAHVEQRGDVQNYQRMQESQCVARELMRATMPTVDVSTDFAKAVTASTEELFNSLHDTSHQDEADALTVELLRSAGYPSLEYEALVMTLGDEGHHGAKVKDSAGTRALKMKALREAAPPFKGKTPPMPAALKL